MEVSFASHQLQRCYENSSQADRTWGESVGRKYNQRISIIKAARIFGDLYRIRSLRIHKLSGRRSDQFAIALNERWRLIVTYADEDNQVRIEEVTNHYGD